MLKADEIPKFLIGDYAGVRKRARAYVRASLKAARWVDDPAYRESVPFDKIQNIILYTSRDIARFVASDESLVTRVLVQDELHEQTFDVACQLRLGPWALLPVARKLFFSGLGEFWFALCVLYFGMDWVDLRGQAKRRAAALEIHKLMRWWGTFISMEGKFRYALDEPYQWPRWASNISDSVATLLGGEWEVERTRVRGLERLGPHEYHRRIEALVLPLLPPGGQWIEPPDAEKIQGRPYMEPAQPLANSQGRTASAGKETHIQLVAGFYWYLVPYEKDAASALRKLRNREFEAGRYYPAMKQLVFPVNELEPTPGKQHKNEREALEASGPEGTHSILDILSVGENDQPLAASPVSTEELGEAFGTSMPCRADVERSLIGAPFVRDLTAGAAVYFIVFKGGAPHEICFIGLSWD